MRLREVVGATAIEREIAKRMLALGWKANVALSDHDFYQTRLILNVDETSHRSLVIIRKTSIS